MVFSFSNVKSFFNKKLLIQVYFVFFILLNIIDFLNIIPNDLDFFKKLLSWTLIGYVFYKVSITKILIGQRIKRYDLGFILAFSFMSIIKSFVLYLESSDITSASFPVFYYFLNLFSSISDFSNFVMIFLVIGLILTLVLSISLIVNYDIKRYSFLGSFDFKDNYFFYLFKYVLSFIFLVFFSLIVFNFFMEWFALAVDSVILVLGILYYLFVYISNHMTNKMSLIFSDISNSGNEFYYNLIEKFSDKKTFFVGVSALLVIHFLVDIGVYLIPYLLGTQNALYFDTLSLAGRSHQSLFGIFDFSSSLLYKDLGFVSNDLLLSFGIVLIYVLNYFLIFSLMFLPFYVFYKNLNKKNFEFKKWFSIFFLSALFFNLVLFFLPTVNTPLKFDSPNVLSVKGVDFYTNSIAQGINSFELLSAVLIFFVILAFLLFRFDKYEFFFNKIILIFVLIFFVFYIYLFFTSSIQDEFREIRENRVFVDYENQGEFDLIENIYLDENYFKPSRVKIDYNKMGITATMTPFSNLTSLEGNYVEYSLNHKDYLFIQVNDVDLGQRIYFNNLDRVYFEGEVYDFNKQKFLENNFSMIYFLGENYFDLNKVSGKYRVNLNLDERDLNEIFLKVNENYFVLEGVKNSLAILRLIFASMFYILGSLAFVWYFSRKNILQQ